MACPQLTQTRPTVLCAAQAARKQTLSGSGLRVESILRLTRQSIDQDTGILEIREVETFGEPIVDGCE